MTIPPPICTPSKASPKFFKCYTNFRLLEKFVLGFVVSSIVICAIIILNIRHF
jgi:hypothetical protein